MTQTQSSEKKPFVKECLVQLEACERMPGDTLDLLTLLGEEFRKIVDEFKLQNQIPTEEDLIWRASENHHCDLQCVDLTEEYPLISDEKKS